MNKKAVLEWLISHFEPFVVHGRLISELVKLVSGTGYEKRFFGMLVGRLKFLDSMGILAVEHKEFEPICENLYSMHLTGTGFNIRILYSFFQDYTPVLLLAFFERAGKSTTDYTSHIEPAMNRFKELEEVYND